jgi:hypothetical protein
MLETDIEFEKYVDWILDHAFEKCPNCSQLLPYINKNSYNCPELDTYECKKCLEKEKNEKPI